MKEYEYSLESLRYLLEEIEILRNQNDEREDQLEKLRKKARKLEGEKFRRSSMVGGNNTSVLSYRPSVSQTKTRYSTTSLVMQPLLVPPSLENNTTAAASYEWVEEELHVLPDDVFTMMFFAHVKSISFLYGIIVYAAQLLILSTITIDLKNDDTLRLDEEDANPLNLPVEKIDIQVRIAQAIAILISVASRDDCTDTFRIVWVGFKRRWTRDFPGAATVPQFILMNVMRFSQGAFVILVSFFFIIQSDNVLDLFLNFAAMEFVATLDNLAYDLAYDGWLFKSVSQLAKDIRQKQRLILNDKDKKKLQRYPLLKQTLFLVTLLILEMGLFRVYIFERNGSLLRVSTCGFVRVDFGDQVFEFESRPGIFQGLTLEPSCAGEEICYLEGSTRPLTNRFNITSPRSLQYEFFSGVYEAFYKRGDRMGDRPVYYERGLKDPTSGKIYYCDEEKAWVFTIEALARAGAVVRGTINRCGEDGWLGRSGVTNAVSLDEVPIEGWKFWTNAVLEDAKEISLVCLECLTDIECGGVVRGSCIENYCVCNPGFFGDYCEEFDSCDKLAVYVEGSASLLGSFGDIRAYGRAVYGNVTELLQPSTAVIPGDDDTTQVLQDPLDPNGIFELVSYTGRRWYYSLYTGAELTEYSQAALSDNAQDILDFARNFHAYWSDVRVEDVVAVSQATPRASPIGPLQWTRILKSHSVGNYGILGATEDAILQMECLSVNCQIPVVCGYHGDCRQVSNIAIFAGTRLTNLSGNQCVCTDNTTTGHFCEYRNVLELNDTQVVRGPLEVDPFLAACAGPYVHLPNCKQIFSADLD